MQVRESLHKNEERKTVHEHLEMIMDMILEHKLT